MGRARVDWRREGVTTSKTRGGTREFKIYKCHPKALPHDGKLPTYSQVSLAVSFELQHTEAAFNMQEKTAVSTVATQVLQSWGGLTNIETTRQDNLETKIKKLRQVERESVKNEDPKALKKRENLEKQGKELFDISKQKSLIPASDLEFYSDQKDSSKRSMSRPYPDPISAGTSFLLDNGDGFSSPISAGTSTDTSFQYDMKISCCSVMNFHCNFHHFILLK